MALDPVDQTINGVSIPTTYSFDVGEIYALDIDDAQKETFVRLYQNLNRMLLALSVKENGFYPLNQIVNGQQFFPNSSDSYMQPINYRDVFRVVINFGALPNATTKSVAHGISVNAGTTFTSIYACASDTTGFNYIPIPYASPTLVNNIELKVDATNVTIITGSNRSNFNVCYVVLNFMKY